MIIDLIFYTEEINTQVIYHSNDYYDNKITFLGTQSDLCEYSDEIESFTGNEFQQGLRQLRATV